MQSFLEMVRLWSLACASCETWPIHALGLAVAPTCPPPLHGA